MIRYIVKGFWLYIFLLFVSTCSFSQDIKISIANKGALIKDNVEIFNPFILLNKEEDKGKYIIAIKSGYMPQAVSVDELFLKNIAEFSFTLSPVAKPTLGKNLKKIRFSKFVDLNYHAGQRGLLSYDLQKNDSKFSVAMDTFFTNKGFNVPPINTVIKEDYKNSDFVLGGEILSYKASKSGTPGFRCSAVFKWSVYDVTQEKIVFSFLSGGYSNEGTKMNESEAFIIAALDAAQELINNKDFIRLINID